MKTLLHKLLLVAILSFVTIHIKAQCSTGYTNASINFDMHYLLPNNLPANPLTFAIGKNSMRFAWSGTNTLRGTNADHTAASGNDFEFVIGNGADTLVFEDEVQNVRFSVQDLDRGHVLTVRAYNAANTAQNVTMTRASGTSITVTGSGGTAPVATTAASTQTALNSTAGTVNIVVASTVKRIVLSFTKSSGTDSIYISDISACINNSVSGTWANGYQAISTPEIGQPSYIVASHGDSIVAVDMTNNTTTLLYEVDNSTLIDTLGLPKAINSLAYDPHRQIVYYCDNARARRNVSIFKYDVKTGVRSTFVADVRTIGIQLFALGMGSGGAAYYDGALYVGQDMINYAGNPEPVTVYRIEIDTITGNPGTVSRVWSKLGYTGSTMLYDWADFVINNGVFYNFNSMNTRAANTGLEHIDLNSNTVTAGYSLASDIVNGSQSGVNYLGNIYHFNGTTYELYNGSGGFGASTSYTGVTGIPLTDVAESFKFPYDYGDAPASYGITYHLFKTNPDLTIGNAIDYEIYNSINAAANGDDNRNTGSSNDEDGITSFPALTVAHASYSVPVRVRNATGTAATLYGYLDFNRDGDFNDAGERSLPANVPTGTTTATPITVTFTGLTGGSVGSSFIRFRLATSSAEAGNRNGFAGSGEVEDYPIPITASTLPVELMEFTATANENNTTQLNWSTASELNNDYFEVQRSQNNTWETIGIVDGNGNSNSVINYSFIDKTPYQGINYYRLKQVDFDGTTDFSPVVSVKFDETSKSTEENEIILYPNPAKQDLWIQSKQDFNEENAPELEVFNMTGEIIYASKMQDKLQRVDISNYSSGMYFIKIGTKTYRLIKE